MDMLEPEKEIFKQFFVRIEVEQKKEDLKKVLTKLIMRKNHSLLKEKKIYHVFNYLTKEFEYTYIPDKIEDAIKNLSATKYLFA